MSALKMIQQPVGDRSFSGRGFGELEGQRQLVSSVHQKVQLVAEPALNRLSGTAALFLSFIGFHPPIGIGIPTTIRGF
jgi:hypothetical protein